MVRGELSYDPNCRLTQRAPDWWVGRCSTPLRWGLRQPLERVRKPGARLLPKRDFVLSTKWNELQPDATDIIILA
jgi:hypothetical protein